MDMLNAVKSVLADVLGVPFVRAKSNDYKNTSVRKMIRGESDHFRRLSSEKRPRSSSYIYLPYASFERESYKIHFIKPTIRSFYSFSLVMIWQ